MKDKKLYNSILLTIDLLMIILVIINLGLLALQYNFESGSIRPIIEENLPWLYHWYLPVYKRFIFVDSIFVAVFITEITVRWILAIINKTYARWYMYPFVHWYDVLGCIPVGAYRFLRIFRIIAIITRLQKMRLIDIRTWLIFKIVAKYINIIVQELSDAVVVNVIEKSQKEIAKGIPVGEKITREVIIPRKGMIAGFISHRVQAISQHQLEQNRDELRDSIKDAIEKAMKEDANVQMLEQIPIIGRAASSALQTSVYEITFQTINNMLEKLGTGESKAAIEQITDSVIEQMLSEEDDKKLREIITEMILHTLEIVKQDVKKQDWKYKASPKQS